LTAAAAFSRYDARDRRLLGELEARARGRGVGVAVLETNERLAAARRLYEASGYEEVGRETHPATDDAVLRYREAP